MIFLEKFTLHFREMLWRARPVVDFRGKAACRVGRAPMQFPHAHMKAGVCPPCSSAAQGAVGILMGMTQMTSCSAINWRPSVMGVARGPVCF